MRAEQELRKPHMIDKQIRVYLARIDQIREGLLPNGIAYDKDRVQFGHSGDKYAAAMGLISEIEGKITKLEQKREWYMNKRIPKMLEQVFDPDAKMIIQMHDVYGFSMEKTAETLYMSRATAYRIRSKGLIDIDQYLQHKTNETESCGIL